jgi:beta-N-acetylhexosaminidase
VSLGPVMLDVRGPELQQDEVELLRHPLVGGVILFSRNYEEPGQLRELTRNIHQLRQPSLLIAVDHEGGRVQRFRDQFTRIPAAGLFGRLYDADRKKALEYVTRAGWLLASELVAVGIDFSFTPVLDVDTGRSKVIGDRAFHHNTDALVALARACTKGMKSAGMAAVGKHFPGHGHVREDSHETVPIDNRGYQDIMMNDVVPFERLISAGIAGIMPAHVIYTAVDSRPAGFSEIWLKQVLRQQLGFQGTIFSDDIIMAGAGPAGSYPERARAALAAGCDMVLVCNNQPAAIEVLNTLQVEPYPLLQVRLMRMRADPGQLSFDELKQDRHWQQTAAEIAGLETAPELDLDDDAVHS